MLDVLNGYKTYIGFALIALAYWLGPGEPPPDFLPESVQSWLLTAGGTIGGFGVIHKMAKLEK